MALWKRPTHKNCGVERCTLCFRVIRQCNCLTRYDDVVFRDRCTSCKERIDNANTLEEQKALILELFIKIESLQKSVRDAISTRDRLY